MKIFYYFDPLLKISPVKEFFEELLAADGGGRHNQNIFKVISGKIEFLAENNGRPIPPVAVPLRGYPFHEIKLSDRNNLIRVLFFAYHQDKLILLSAFNKPKHYDEKGKNKKVHFLIEKEYNKARLYYEKFLNNPNCYEEF